jgi:hypothetical protein
MTGQVAMGGGFADGRHDRMSDSLMARLAESDAREAQHAARAAAEREQRAADLHDRAVQAATNQARERGEQVDMRRVMRGEGVGHAPSDFIAQAACCLLTARGVSAPTPQEKVEREQSAARVERFRAKRRENAKLLKTARWVAQRGPGRLAVTVTAEAEQVAQATEAPSLGEDAAAAATPGVGTQVVMPSLPGPMRKPKGEGFEVPGTVPALRPVAPLSATPTYGSPAMAGVGSSARWSRRVCWMGLVRRCTGT